MDRGKRNKRDGITIHWYLIHSHCLKTKSHSSVAVYDNGMNFALFVN